MIDFAPDVRTLDALEPGVLVDFRGWTIARLKRRGSLYAWRGARGESGMERARSGKAIMKKIYAEERRSGRW